MGLPRCLSGKEFTYKCRGLRRCGLIPGFGRSPGEGNGNPLQYSSLENPMVEEAWWATVHGVAKSQTRLSDFISLHFFHFRTQYSLGFHIISTSQNCLNINGFYHFNRPESISDSCLRTLISITTFYSKDFFPNVML